MPPIYLADAAIIPEAMFTGLKFVAALQTVGIMLLVATFIESAVPLCGPGSNVS